MPPRWAAAVVVAAAAAVTVGAVGVAASCGVGVDVHVMVMTHARPGAVCAVLAQVAAQVSPPSRVHVTIAQSAPSPLAPAVVTLAHQVQHGVDGCVGPAGQPYAATFGGVVHVLTPYWPDDDSATTHRRHGSKRNSMANLLSGLDVAFTGRQRRLAPGGGSAHARGSRAADDDAAWAAYWQVDDDGGGDDGGGLAAWAAQRAAYRACLEAGSMRVAGLVVLEDDIVLSRDAFAFFHAAARAGSAPRSGIHFASALAVTRPSLLWGHTDTSIIAAVHALPWFNPAAVINQVVGNHRTVFKTLAWWLSALGYTTLAPALHTAVTTDLPPHTKTFLATWGGRTPPLPALRSDLPLLRGCPWCNDYCYDHVIEWVVQGMPYLVPQVARVSQLPGSGMTSHVNTLNPIHTGPPVPVDRFRVASLAASLYRCFPNPGISTLSPPLPADPTLRVALLSMPAGDAVTAMTTPTLGELVAMYSGEPSILLATIIAALTITAVVVWKWGPAIRRWMRGGDGGGSWVHDARRSSRGVVKVVEEEGGWFTGIITPLSTSPMPSLRGDGGAAIATGLSQRHRGHGVAGDAGWAPTSPSTATTASVGGGSEGVAIHHRAVNVVNTGSGVDPPTIKPSLMVGRGDGASPVQWVSKRD